MTPPTHPWPDGKRFAFTVIDDTDVATLENVRPIYRLFEELGMRTTKTVWPVACPEGSRNFSSSETLEDPSYRDFVVDLARRGFEVTWHGATMESSRRERTEAALERFHDLLGHYPRIHVNHSYNRENLYWGGARFDFPLLRVLFGRLAGLGPDHFQGHVEGSPWWWGDLARQHITYGRNLTFNEINLLRINPSMPYRDPRRPLVEWWFSGSDAEGVHEFNELLRPENQERLEAEGGLCIVATHLGKGFAGPEGVHPLTRERLEMLARRPGWFPTVGTLLDWLRERRSGERLPGAEWRRMQYQWAVDLVRRKREARRAKEQRVVGD